MTDNAAHPEGIEPQDKLTYSNPEGYLCCDGRVRIYGYSEPPPQPQTPPLRAGDGPMVLTLEPRRYSWCSCGHSQNQPFCDNAHREEDTNRKSYKFEVLETCTIEFCMCKQTKNPPFCDGSHEHCPANGQPDSGGSAGDTGDEPGLDEGGTT